jgi:short-subunit dehydrogenase
MTKKAIVTGATKGIGRAITIALAKEGYDIALCSRNNAELQAFKTELEELYKGIKVWVHPTDMGNMEEILQFMAYIKSHWLQVDVLVNNAGSFIPGSIHTEGPDTLEKMLNINLFSAYHITREILPMMIAAQKGYIFNMCSVASIQAYPNGGSYSISKFALLGFSKNLREEMKPHNIKVTAILPGATWSDSWAGFEAPRERLMEAEDIAEAVVSALRMSAGAVVEEIILRPQLGDL